MNIAQSKKIRIEDVIAKQGLSGNFSHEKKQGRELWYLSPFREEDTPSFKIDTEKNRFYDFGNEKHGDTLQYVCDYYGEDVRGGLQRLTEIFGGVVPKNPHRPPQAKKTASKPRFKVKGAKKIHDRDLFGYIDSRGINRKVAWEHLKQVHYYDREQKKTWRGVAMENVSGGWEVKNAFYSTAIGSKDFTLIQGHRGVNHALHIFEGFTDAMTFLTVEHPNKPLGDILILNTCTMADKAMKWAEKNNYPNVITWLDNDPTGEKYTNLIKEKYRPDIVQMNEIYMGFKDLNEWHVDNLNNGIESAIIFDDDDTPILDDRPHHDPSQHWQGNRATPEQMEEFKKYREKQKAKEDNEPFGMTDDRMMDKLNRGNGYKPHNKNNPRGAK